ncbi:unannotated protein [freshwater metagenome]|uniref:Unannotated protein n=1 Tax=freshwater metagenome TaxID=449393 RepID=A0A6J7JF07_9ZZZZ|nr:acyltransferase family protein [Actinomycetota bacterium]
MRGNLAYRPGLDGVRALAVLGVLLYHGGVAPFPGGFLGVDVFFVLSGFLITSLLLREFDLTGTIRLVPFWLGRIRRLLPAALLVIVASLLAVALFSTNDLGALRGDSIASALYVNNWHQVFADRSYFEAFGRPSLLQHYWSLAVEEQFYLLWPPLLLAGLLWLGRRWTAFVVVVAAALSLALMALLYDPASDPSRVYYGTDTRAMPILIGVALAFVWPAMLPGTRSDIRGRTAIDALGLVGLAGVIAAMVSIEDSSGFTYRGGLLLVALASALLIAAVAHPASRLGRLMGAAPCVWIGARSYGIYLWHWPIMAMTRPGQDISESKALIVALQIAATLVVAELSYRYIELPVRRRHFEAWVRERVAGSRTRRGAALAGAAALVAGFIVLIAALPTTTRDLSRLPVATAAASGRPSAVAGGAQPVSVPISARIGEFKLPLAAGRWSYVAPKGPVLMVGASVMLGTQPALKERINAKVDAAVSRSPQAIIDRLAAYRAADALPPVVGFQVGENGPLTKDMYRQLRAALKGVPRVIIVTIRAPSQSWVDETNDQLHRLTRTWPEATIADWYEASSDPSLLWDGTHPNPEGQKRYAEVVAQAIGR